jgi:hypothetical protein
MDLIHENKLLTPRMKLRSSLLYASVYVFNVIQIVLAFTWYLYNFCLVFGKINCCTKAMDSSDNDIF